MAGMMYDLVWLKGGFDLWWLNVYWICGCRLIWVLDCRLDTARVGFGICGCGGWEVHGWDGNRRWSVNWLWLGWRWFGSNMFWDGLAVSDEGAEVAMVSCKGHGFVVLVRLGFGWGREVFDIGEEWTKGEQPADLNLNQWWWTSAGREQGWSNGRNGRFDCKAKQEDKVKKCYKKVKKK